MPSLAEWDVVAHGIDAIYREDLLRSGGEITIGEMANWLYHAIEGGHDLDWIRDRIRESPEYQEKHGGGSPPVPPPPVPGRPSAPEPDGPGGAPSAPLPAAGGGRVYKVTDASDGDFVNRGYSYWSQAWISGGAVYCFAGHVDNRPRFFRVELATGSVQRLGPVLQYEGTSEGWSFDLDGFVYLLDGPRLRRVNPFTAQDSIVFDISDTHPGCILWQSHSSDDGQTHSATVKRIVNDGAYPSLGTVVFRRGTQEYFPANGDLDESQITPEGGWLVIKEDDRNRIIELATRVTRTITNAEGAVGHSDCGPGILVGEDDQHGACVLWDLRKNQVRELFLTWNMGHLSIRGGRCLLSDATRIALVALDGSGVTPLLTHGMVSDGAYDTQVFANLDPTGRIAAYMSNAAGRLDLYLYLL